MSSHEIRMRKRSSEEKVGKKKIRKKKIDKFVWWKKIERDVLLGRGVIGSAKSEKKRYKERIAEIEKLKKRREERLIEKARWDEEMMMLQRQRVWAESDASLFEKKECQFILDQCKAKSRIRFYEDHSRRIKPIDILTLNYDLDLDDHNNNMELDEPCLIFKGLTVRDIEELRGEIELRLGCLHRIRIIDDHHIHIHKHIQDCVEFWEALLLVCDWELGELGKWEKESGMHPSIETDVRSFLQGIQSYDELMALQAQIESDMRAGKSKVVEFWQVVLAQIHVYKAKAFLKEFHHNHKQLRKNKIKNEQEEYKDVRLAIYPDPPAEDRPKEEDDFEAMVKKEVMGGGDIHLEEGESVLAPSAEVNLDLPCFLWHDLYKPTKPKYFVKFHTGYVWNQYNRTHYDKQNPPPKFIQGYKFNIFYPHLIDHTTTPQCFIDKDGDAEDTCILRFHAGPPYEDIAFRISSKDWEYSRVKGFKCTFEAGILRLYFNFKSFHYRR